MFFQPFLEERLSQRTLMRGMVKTRTAPRAKFLLKLFSKSLSRAAGETAVARRNERNNHGLFFLLSFLFWLEQERAQWAMKRVRSTEKTRSVECDLAFKATMFLTVSLCVKRKSAVDEE